MIEGATREGRNSTHVGCCKKSSAKNYKTTEFENSDDKIIQKLTSDCAMMVARGEICENKRWSEDKIVGLHNKNSSRFKICISIIKT